MAYFPKEGGYYYLLDIYIIIILRIKVVITWTYVLVSIVWKKVKSG